MYPTLERLGLLYAYAPSAVHIQDLPQALWNLRGTALYGKTYIDSSNCLRCVGWEIRQGFSASDATDQTLSCCVSWGCLLSQQLCHAELQICAQHKSKEDDGNGHEANDEKTKKKFNMYTNITLRSPKSLLLLTRTLLSRPDLASLVETITLDPCSLVQSSSPLYARNLVYDCTLYTTSYSRHHYIYTTLSPPIPSSWSLPVSRSHETEHI